jgi:hypothetical protein
MKPSMAPTSRVARRAAGSDTEKYRAMQSSQ